MTNEGDFGHGFFAIEDGTAEVLRDDTVVASLGPGDVFGEIALLASGRRTASVVATTPMRRPHALQARRLGARGGMPRAGSGAAYDCSSAPRTHARVVERGSREARAPLACLCDERGRDLHDVPGRQVLRPRAAGALEHLALVPARGEDRRARAEWRRQVDAPADHGRPRGALVRRRRARPEGDCRLPAAGARARRGEGRPRERRGRSARAPRPARPLQRHLRGLRRARRGLRRPARRAGDGAGADRPRRCVEPRPDARSRDGRAAAAGRRPRRDDPLGRRAPPRRPLPAPARRPRPAPSRRAYEPPRRRVGGLAGAVPRGIQGHRDRGHARSLLPRQRRGLDPRARPRQRDPVSGQLLVVARAEGGAARGRGEAERRHAAARCSASSSGCG